MRIPSCVAEREKLKQIVTPTRQELTRRDSEVMMCVRVLCGGGGPVELCGCPTVHHNWRHVCGFRLRGKQWLCLGSMKFSFDPWHRYLLYIVACTVMHMLN